MVVRGVVLVLVVRWPRIRSPAGISPQQGDASLEWDVPFRTICSSLSLHRPNLIRTTIRLVKLKEGEEGAQEGEVLATATIGIFFSKEALLLAQELKEKQ